MILAKDLRIGNYILYLNELYIVDGIQYEMGLNGSDNWRINFRTIDDKNASQKDIAKWEIRKPD